MKHDLYRDGDADAPPQIRDRNGSVVLSLCKRCGMAEAELQSECQSRGVRRLGPDGANFAFLSGEADPMKAAEPGRRFWVECTMDPALLRAALDAETARWEEAVRLTWQMADQLKLAGQTGSYWRGLDAGIVAALTTLRANLKAPNVNSATPPAA